MFFFNELKPLLARISSNSADFKSIQLSHKKITDKNLSQISDALQTNTNINEIWLTNNLITEVGSLTAVLESNCSVASCISTLIRRNSTITDIGIEENNISDAGARMLADALSHNSTLQTLKLNGNNIDSFDTMILINEKLKKNKDCAKQKLLEEHPEYGMQKIKKEKKKNRGSKSEKVKSEMKSDDAKANAGIPKSEVPSGCARDNAGITNELQSSKNSFDKVEPSQKIMTDNFKSGLKVRTKQNSARGSTNKQEGTFC